jgi:uncharacterized membrane protein
MDWLRRYRLRNYLKNSIWVPAFSALFAGLVVLRISRELSPHLGYDFFGFGPEGAQAIMSAVVTATFSFMVFVFSMLLVAVQLASAQLTPRVIASLLGDAASRRALAIFVFSFAFDIGALGRVEGGDVPQLVIFLAILCTVASVAAFLHLIDHVGTSLRPVSVLSSTGDRGLEVIKDIYPAPFTGLEKDPGIPDPSRRSRTILHEGRSGVFLAFDVQGLVELARRAGCALALKPQVGDFVSNGDVLCEAYGDASELDERAVRLSVAIGRERNPEQDPAFAFRIIVDIASKALSPAINDPTTAVLALDQLQRLLRSVGGRRLDTGEVRDAAGVVRLVYRTPDWEDFVCLAVSEIRQFGASCLQVPRRLNTLLQSLMASLPAERLPALQREKDQLDRAVDRAFADHADRENANAADSQGLGAPTG